VDAEAAAIQRRRGAEARKLLKRLLPETFGADPRPDSTHHAFQVVAPQTVDVQRLFAELAAAADMQTREALWDFELRHMVDLLKVLPASFCFLDMRGEVPSFVQVPEGARREPLADERWLLLARHQPDGQPSVQLVDPGIVRVLGASLCVDQAGAERLPLPSPPSPPPTPQQEPPARTPMLATPPRPLSVPTPMPPLPAAREPMRPLPAELLADVCDKAAAGYIDEWTPDSKLPPRFWTRVAKEPDDGPGRPAVLATFATRALFLVPPYSNPHSPSLAVPGFFGFFWVLWVL
jgi:hypothetical protein